MALQTDKLLQLAVAHFYAWQLPEAYTHFRRYFDRLPFAPSRDHAQHIGMFARVLVELGKQFELKFYVGELEKLADRQPKAFLRYQLGVVYLYLDPPRMEAARELLEGIILDPEGEEFHAKAKMCLASYYDRVKGDHLACRLLINSIGEPGDPQLRRLVQIWRGKNLRDEGRIEESRTLFELVLSDPEISSDWYAQFCAHTGLAATLVKQGEIGLAEGLVVELRARFAVHDFKSVLFQIAELERLLKESAAPYRLRFVPGPRSSELSFDDRKLTLSPSSSAAKLLALLARGELLDKPTIVKKIYRREYHGEQDDRLVYYQIHSLRKRLKSIGLPAEVIRVEENGYRLFPTVEWVTPEDTYE